MYLLSAALLLAPASSAALQNVNGGELQKCSGTGMALTGFTRNGKCMDQYAAAQLCSHPPIAQHT